MVTFQLTTRTLYDLIPKENLIFQETDNAFIEIFEAGSESEKMKGK